MALPPMAMPPMAMPAVAMPPVAVPPVAVLAIDVMPPSCRERARRASMLVASTKRGNHHGRTSLHPSRPGCAGSVGYAHHLQRAGDRGAGAARLWLHGRTDGLHRPKGQANRRLGPDWNDPRDRTATLQGR